MTTTKRPGRPRSDAADRAILQAALEEFAERGYHGFSIERVARRAGVGKTTIYRRWSTKEEVVIAAITAVVYRIEQPDTGSVELDLITIMTGVRRHLFMSRVGDTIPFLAAEVYQRSALGELDRQVLLGWIMTTLRQAIDRGIERGELREDLDAEVLAELLMGGLLLEHLTGRLGARGGASLPRALVVHAMRGARKGEER